MLVDKSRVCYACSCSIQQRAGQLLEPGPDGGGRDEAFHACVGTDGMPGKETSSRAVARLNTCIVCAQSAYRGLFCMDVYGSVLNVDYCESEFCSLDV